MFWADLGQRADAQENLLYTFTDEADGGSPYAGLVLDSSGNLYGTAPQGGIGYGVVFALTQVQGSWQYEVIYTFTGGQDGGYPSGGLVIDPAGNLYGTAAIGGDTTNCPTGCGVVFQLRKAQVGWNEQVLYRFSGGTDGSDPYGGVILDKAENLYGIDAAGGSNQCQAGCGVVYELEKVSASVEGLRREITLYSFTNGSGGTTPINGLVFDQSDNLYGVASGGSVGQGLVYELSPAGNGWQQKVIYDFPGGRDGSYPVGTLTLDKSGNLYGATNLGGDGYGAVYELSKSNGTWREKILHGFGQTGDGIEPEAGVIFDTAGDLYGTTGAGGAYGNGMVFELTPNQNGTWSEHILYSFTGGNDGGAPLDSVTLDSELNAYGTTFRGGAYQSGVVFEILH